MRVVRDYIAETLLVEMISVGNDFSARPSRGVIFSDYNPV